MSTIAVPSTTSRWPRAALATIVALFVALVVTISLAFALGGHTTTRTVVRQPGSVSADCLFHSPGHPC
jgi:hypothetical protein